MGRPMTTFCELRMEGKSTQSRELAENIVQQIQFQDWSDIVQQGTGAGSSGHASGALSAETRDTGRAGDAEDAETPTVAV